MTIVTYQEAVDEMFGLVKTTLDAEALVILGHAPDVRWQGVEESDPPALDTTWVHVYQSTVNTRQAGLNNAVSRRYTTVGVLLVDIFVPRSLGQAMEHGRELTEGLRRAFEGTRTGGVWYRNVTATEGGQTDSFSVFRMTADYEYAEEGS